MKLYSGIFKVDEKVWERIRDVFCVKLRNFGFVTFEVDLKEGHTCTISWDSGLTMYGKRIEICKYDCDKKKLVVNYDEDEVKMGALIPLTFKDFGLILKGRDL